MDVNRFGNPDTPHRTIKLSARKAMKKLRRTLPPSLQELNEHQFTHLIDESLRLYAVLGRVREEVTNLTGDMLGFFLVEQASTLSKRTRFWPRLTPSSKPKPPTG